MQQCICTSVPFFFNFNGKLINCECLHLYKTNLYFFETSDFIDPASHVIFNNVTNFLRLQISLHEETQCNKTELNSTYGTN